MAEINHGTRHGYNSCSKRPGGACDECKRAAADYEAARRRRKRVQEAEDLAAAFDEMPDRDGPLNLLAEYHTSLKMTDAMLYRSTSVRDTASLLQRRSEVLEKISELERQSAAGKKVSPRDEIAERRKQRRSSLGGNAATG